MTGTETEKTMNRPVRIVMALLLFLAFGAGYGDESELRGAKRLFVDTGDNVDLHDRIVERLRDKIHAPVAFVDDDSDADVILHVRATSNEAKAVADRVTEGGHVHHVWSAHAGKLAPWDTPWHDVVDQFASVYSSYNHL